MRRKKKEPTEQRDNNKQRFANMHMRIIYAANNPWSSEKTKDTTQAVI